MDNERPDQRDDDEGAADRPNRTDDPRQRARWAAMRTERIREHLKQRQSRLEVVSTTKTPLGQVVDWVPAERVAPAGRIADPPDEDGPDRGVSPEGPADGDEIRPAELVRFELEDERAERGPAGTVPVVRRNPDAITSTRTLQDFLSKHGRSARLLPDGLGEAALPEDGDVHKYAYTAQWVTAYGCEGNINAWDPYLEWSDEFSLGQCLLARGSGAGKQTIEAGQQEFRDLYGDWVPHLFVFYTTNGYTQQGDNQGGYNTDVDGWVQYSSRVYPGALSSPVSVFGGTQYVMNLKWQLWQRNWWLRCNGNWIGYYPASLFGDSGLSLQAEKVAWYGEIVDSGAHAGTTATDMGTGHWPYEGWQRCAYMANLSYQSDTGGGMSRYAPGSVYATNPMCYDIAGHFDNTGSWQSYFWWGGSGRNSLCP